MVVEPDNLIDRYIDAGCDIVIVHAEACLHLHRTLKYIADTGAVPGVALNPHTPPELINEVKDLLGLALVMTVNPGFGGQKYISSMEPKIKRVAEILDGLDCDIEVDGGIGVETASGAVQAGANVLVSGSALYKDPKGLENAVKELRTKFEIICKSLCSKIKSINQTLTNIETNVLMSCDLLQVCPPHYGIPATIL